jgi:hypothetical protein
LCRGKIAERVRVKKGEDEEDNCGEVDTEAELKREEDG